MTGDECYPVVYVHGGRHAVKLGRLTDTLDTLIGTSLEPVIVVLIDVAAGHIFTPRDGYGELWANELVPFIDENFRTIATRDARAKAGAGVAAHEAAHCAFRYPHLSSKLAIQSLTMVDFGWERLKPLIATPEEHPLKLHVEWGVYDLRDRQEAWDMGERRIRRFPRRARLRGRDFRGGRRLRMAGVEEPQRRCAREPLPAR